MSFVQRELDRIAEALGKENTLETYGRLIAAQQALAWAQEPAGFASPYEIIIDPLTHQQASQANCEGILAG